VGIHKEDESFHERNDSPYWNESAWFSFMVPERKLDGWVYMYHRPNMKLSAGGIGLWDPSGQEIYDCLYYNLDEHQALPDGADMHDFTLRNGLTARTVEPLKQYQFSFDGDGCQAELTWTALMEPHELNRKSPGLAEWGTSHGRHYDQAGLMTGHVVVEGEEILIDGPAIRDHTWGPRGEDRPAPKMGYDWAILSERASFQTFAPSRLGARENPELGVAYPVTAGWYTRDGKIGTVVSGERRVLERGPDGRPRKVAIDAKDDLGRNLNALGTCENLLNWPCYGWAFEYWCLTRWEFDGLTAYGEVNDHYPLQELRYFKRSLAGSR
jgi:hypothetical protein